MIPLIKDVLGRRDTLRALEEIHRPGMEGDREGMKRGGMGIGGNMGMFNIMLH